LLTTLALIAGSSAVFAQSLPKAVDIYPKMGLGYNIGNTMEVPGNQGGPTGWGNPFPDAAYVKAIKDAGFNTVRIPCAWDTHASNGTINAGWLDSVKTVVDLVIGNGMYAILNSHWDGGWLEDHVFDGQGFDKNGETTVVATELAAKQENYWKQIATKFAEYDEHLIFASANEPGVNDPWNGGADNGQWAFDEARMQVLKSYHEACLKAVRSTGGNNATRIVVVQSPRTEIDKTPLLSSMYPEDPAGAGYTMAEVHFYPYQFTLMTGGDEDWGKMFYYWEDKTPGNDAAHTCSGTALGSKKSIDELFSGLKTRFYDKGIPVVIGEMGAVKRLNALSGDNLKAHLEARSAWYGYTVAAAKKNGLVPCVWDTGDEGDGNFTIIRRQVNKYNGNVGDIVDVETLNAMREAYGQASVPGNTIDSTVKESISTGEKALHISYQTQTSDSSEAGTMRINFSGADWTQYVAISFDMRVEGASAGPCTDATREGCGEFGWASVSLFNMSGEWAWKEVSLGNVSEMSEFKNYKVEFGAEEGQLTFVDQKDVKTIGLNLYGTQFTGDMYLDNMLLWKTDGSVDTVSNFNKVPELAGIATGKLVAESATGDFGTKTEVTTQPGNQPGGSDALATRGYGTLDFKAFVQNGSVQVLFTAVAGQKSSVMLLNGLGQVIAQKNIAASNGANRIELRSNYRGPAMLVVKQGKQQLARKVILK
jgi:aryl-phospho-beta-D-glucosidase BglC (GH1 family)